MLRVLKKLNIAVLAAVCCVLLTSCFSSTEPSRLAPVNSMLYDIREGKFFVEMEIMSADETEKSQTVKGVGLTLSEAYNKASEGTERKIFGNHNKACIITESFAENAAALEIFRDFVLRNSDFEKKSLLFVISDSDAEKLYSNNFAGDYLESLVENKSATTSSSAAVTVSDFMRDILTEGKEPIAGLITVDGDTLRSEGLAVFKNGRFSGFLDAESAAVYNMLGNAYGNTVFSTGDASIVLKNARTRIRTYLKEGIICVDAEVRSRAEVSLSASGKSLDELKCVFEKKAAEDIKNSIEKCRNETGGDIYGFGRYFTVQHPEYEYLVTHNENYFDSMIINTKCVVNLEGGLCYE